MPSVDYTQKDADKDFVKLTAFHERAYGGIQHTEKQIKEEHDRWWRLSNYYRAINQSPPLEVLLTLLYCMKYLPSTHGEIDG
jgi:hypothetical protein